jgi:hypothetical protein
MAGSRRGQRAPRKSGVCLEDTQCALSTALQQLRGAEPSDHEGADVSATLALVLDRDPECQEMGRLLGSILARQGSRDTLESEAVPLLP